MQISLRPGLPLALAAAIVIAIPSVAHAIPAFARRYETSCTTCHTVFPRLNPFGEAFRRNAYRFPAGNDATAEKEEPLALGSEAHKELYPKAVWPGQIPRAFPLSLVADGNAAFGPHPESHSMAGMAMDSGHDEMASSSLNLGTLGGHVMLRSAGTLGPLAAFFGGIDFGGHEPVGVERAAVTFTPLSDPTALQVKVGRFEPELHGISIHRGLLQHQLRLTTATTELSPFAPEPSVNGLQAGGLIGGRMGWNLGAVESVSGNLSWQKDLYGRVEGKLGGMRLDGAAAEAKGAAWSERSLLVGASYWMGTASISKADKMLHNEIFWRAGVDAHAVLDDFTLDVVVARQHHNQPTEAMDAPREVDLAFAELSWIPTPVLVPLCRFEWSKTTGGPAEQTRWLATGGVNWVLRPNLVWRLWANAGADPGDHAELRSVAVGFSGAL